MKIAHLSDLHLGKRLKEYSLIEDQRYILGQITAILQAEKVTTVLIAGDIYDTGNPSAEAIAVFSSFLYELTELHMSVLIIAGNHDSGTRLAYGAEIFARANIHIVGKYTGMLDKWTLSDEYGDIHFYSLPYIRPLFVNQYLAAADAVEGYTAAVQHAIQTVQLVPTERNLIMAHQFITGAAYDADGSEINVGGTDNVDGNIFREFDYVALGHIHRPQHVLRETMRYCGTPLKYSLGEANTQKSLTIVDMRQKGDIRIERFDLKPLRDVCIVKDTYAHILRRNDIERNDYIQFRLEDRQMVPNAMNTLRKIYPNILGISYPRSAYTLSDAADVYSRRKNQSPQELFADFFQLYANHPPDEEQKKIVDELIMEIWQEGAE